MHPSAASVFGKFEYCYSLSQKDEVLSSIGHRLAPGIGHRLAPGIGHRAYLTFLRTAIYLKIEFYEL
jgi:hypothetical protein